MTFLKNSRVRCIYKGYTQGFINYDKMLEMMEYVLKYRHKVRSYSNYLAHRGEDKSFVPSVIANRSAKDRSPLESMLKRLSNL